jgi:hypothetical protein
MALPGRPRKQRSEPLPVRPLSPEKGTDEYWLATLPKPPRPPLGNNDETIAQWMRDVLDVGGVDGLRWAFTPGNWPFGNTRPRFLHVYQRMLEEADEQAKAKRLEVARTAQDRARLEAHQARVKAGWV